MKQHLLFAVVMMTAGVLSAQITDSITQAKLDSIDAKMKMLKLKLNVIMLLDALIVKLWVNVLMILRLVLHVKLLLQILVNQV